MAQGKFATKPSDLARLMALQAKVDLQAARIAELEAEVSALRRREEHLKFVHQTTLTAARSLAQRH